MDGLPSGPSMDMGSVCRKYQAQLPLQTTTARNYPPTETPTDELSGLLVQQCLINLSPQAQFPSYWHISMEAQAHLISAILDMPIISSFQSCAGQETHRGFICILFVSCLLDPPAVDENSGKGAVSVKVDGLIKIFNGLKMLECCRSEPHCHLS